MSDGGCDWASVSGVWFDEGSVPDFAWRFCGSMGDAPVYLWCDRTCCMVLGAQIYLEKRSEESWKMGDYFVPGDDGVLCVPDG